MLMQVTKVPAGVRPDDVFEIVLDLRLFSVICPLDAEGGDNIVIVAPVPKLKEGEEGVGGGGGGRGVAFDSSVVSVQEPFRVNTALSAPSIIPCAVSVPMNDTVGAAQLDNQSQVQLPRGNAVGVGAAVSAGIGASIGDSAGAVVSDIQSDSCSDHEKCHAVAASTTELTESAAGASDSADAHSSIKNAELDATAAVRAAELSACEKSEVRDIDDLCSALSSPSDALCGLQTAASASSAAPLSCDRSVSNPAHCELKGDADTGADVDVSASMKQYSLTAAAGADDMSAVTDRLASCLSDQQYPRSCAAKSIDQGGHSESEPPVVKQRQQRPHTPLGKEDTQPSTSAADFVPAASPAASPTASPDAKLKSTSETEASAALDLNQLACNKLLGANCDIDAAEQSLLSHDGPQPVALKGMNRKQRVDSTDRMTRNTSTKCPLCTYENSERDVRGTNTSFCSVCRQDLRGAVHTPVAVKIPLATPCLTVISSLR